MSLVVTPPVGDPYPFRSTSFLNAVWTSKPILEGVTYPALSFLDGIDTVVDVGANCGAASLYFAQQYPGASVHAIEPGAEQLECLRHNVHGFPNIAVHPIGLSNEDRAADLYLAEDSGQASVYRGSWHSDATETITLRSAAGWAAEQGIERIDLLKVDAELSELDVLTSFGPLVGTTSVVYFEFGSRTIRRAIDDLLAPTHELFLAEMSIDQGECVYLRRDLADDPAIPAELLAILGRRRASILAEAES
jgi:FkbM family methyltransferase